MITSFKIFLFDLLNRLVPKKKAVIITGGQKADANAIEIANYIADHYDFPVYYVVNDFFKPYADEILSSNVRKLDIESSVLLVKNLTSKYKITTHDLLRKKNNSRQVFVNLWHGVGHKKVKDQIHCLPILI